MFLVQFELYIRKIDGQTVAIRVKKHDTVQTAFKKLRAHVDPAVDQQRMVFESRTLDKTKTLDQCNVVNYSTLYMTCRMSGGSTC